MRLVRMQGVHGLTKLLLHYMSMRLISERRKGMGRAVLLSSGRNY